MDLRLARRIKNISQAELGAAVGVDGSYISKLEDGTRPIGGASYFVIARIALELGVDNPIDLFPVPPFAAAAPVEVAS